MARSCIYAKNRYHDAMLLLTIVRIYITRISQGLHATEPRVSVYRM